MDFITELPLTERGHNMVYVVVDKLTKMVHLIPTHNTATAEDCAKLYFKEVVRLHGLPSKIISDRDSKFSSAFWKQLWQCCNTSLGMSTAFHPQTDGQTERVNRVLEDALRHYVNAVQDDWDEHLPHVEFAMNNTWHASTHCTPFYLNYGFHPRTPLDLVLPESAKVPASVSFVLHQQHILQAAKQALLNAQERMKKWANTRRRNVQYSVGTQVLLNTKNIKLKTRKGPGVHKLLPRWIGPFNIKRRIGEVAYELDLPPVMKIHPVFHVSLMKPYRSDGTVQPPQPELSADGDELYEIERILDCRDHNFGSKRSHKEFLVKWKGQGHEHNSWESLEKLKTASKAVREFWTWHKARQQ
jgi:hypothetical protein